MPATPNSIGPNALDDLHYLMRKAINKFIIVYGFAFLIAVGGAYLLQFNIQKEIAESIANATRGSLIIGDYRGASTILNTVGSQFAKIQFEDHNGRGRIGNIDPTTTPHQTWRELVVPIYSDEAKSVVFGKMRFFYNPMPVLLGGFGLWMMLVIASLPLFFRSRSQILKVYQEKIEAQRAMNLADIAKQVSHDIRSPLAALNAIMGHITDLPEEKRILIRASVNRINDIANDLLQKGKANQISDPGVKADKMIDCLLAEGIESLISEKRIQYRDKNGVDISTNANSAYGVFVRLDVNEFKRTLSNLINNSVEAFKDRPGKIVVAIENAQDNATISISDNGVGIPPEILAKLGQPGVSHGKAGSESGSGIGVYHAKKTIESFSGTFSIESTLGKGTTTTLTLPKSKPPPWFVNQLVVAAGYTVVICDDDNAIHSLWKGRFQSIVPDQAKLILMNFTSGAVMKEWYFREGHSVDSILFLVDYELSGQAQSGLDLIAELGIGPKSILVTSRYDEPAIRTRCDQLNLRQIPKGMAGFVPIVLSVPKEKPDAIVLDDEDLQKMMWEFAAKQHNKNVVVFSAAKTLMDQLDSFDRSVPFYIDSNLGNGVSGQTVARNLYDLGFQNLYLATGYEPTRFSHLAFLKGVVGKDPVF